MKRWQTWKIGLFVALCILLNFAGRMVAEGLELPLWLDSFGTVVCAYAGGPICGMIVGLTGNLIYGMLNHGNFIYALTGATLGLIVGIGARRGKLNTLFGAMSVAAVAAVAAVIVSVPLNIIFHGGSTGNLGSSHRGAVPGGVEGTGADGLVRRQTREPECAGSCRGVKSIADQMKQPDSGTGKRNRHAPVRQTMAESDNHPTQNPSHRQE